MQKMVQYTKKAFNGLLVALGGVVVLAVLMVFSTGIYKGKSLLGTTKTVQGTVESVCEGGVNDAVFGIAGDKNTYYINRGLQYYYSLEELKKLTVGKNAEVSYVSQFNLLDIKRRVRHMNKLVVGGKVLFDEANDIPGEKVVSR